MQSKDILEWNTINKCFLPLLHRLAESWERQLQDWELYCYPGVIWMSPCRGSWKVFSSIMTLQSIQTFLTFVRQGSWWHSASYVYLGFWFGIVHMGCINWMGSMERFSGYRESMRLDNIWTLASTMGDGWQIKGPFGADLVCLQFLATIIWSRVHSLFWAIILIVRWSPWSPYNIGFSVLYLGKFTYRKMKKKKTFV